MVQEGVQIQLVLPADLISKILADEETACKELRQLVIFELVRNEEIITTHAASLMNMVWEDFVRFMGEKGIPYFNQGVEEYNEQYKVYKAVLKKLLSKRSYWSTA